ncbi:MAG: hypothetical protein U0836_23265 [Pirellulales bacterium]
MRFPTLVPLAVLLVAASISARADDSGPKVVKLELSPQAEPRPALKYQLLPDLAEQEPGNAATFYFRALAWEGRDFFNDEEYSNKVYNWLGVQLTDLPLQDVENTVGVYRNQLEEVRRASLRVVCDWEDPVREQGFATLLPHLQKTRALARVLALKARLQIAQGKFDEAAKTLVLGFSLGQHSSQGTTLIHALVGAVHVGLMLDCIEDWVGRPGAPNLYWALSTVPEPLISVRKALEFERHGLEFSAHLLKQLDQRALSPEEAQTLAREIWQWAGDSAAGRDQIQDTLFVAGWALKNYGAARADLLVRGYSESQLNAWPALQVVLLHAWKQFEEIRDDYFKWTLAAQTASPAMRAQIEDVVKQAEREGKGYPFIRMLPAVSNARESLKRAPRRIDALRTVEALRLFAAKHGRLPKSLDEIQDVPVPVDVLTGQPFPYRLEGDKAILELPQPANQHISDAHRYEITLRK